MNNMNSLKFQMSTRSKIGINFELLCEQWIRVAAQKKRNIAGEQRRTLNTNTDVGGGDGKLPVNNKLRSSLRVS